MSAADPAGPGAPQPTPEQVRRWRRNLADERAEGAVYRDLAARRTGTEREILLGLEQAERRHAAHWEALLGDHAGKPVRPSLRSRALGGLARRFGGVFVLAMAQRAEARGTQDYEGDGDATATMIADERIHEEVVRGLAARGRNSISGSFRAAVFGANDGLVSNLALILGIGASGASNHAVLLTGLAGLLAGALSMGAGEFVSVRSQRELLDASTPVRDSRETLAALDVNANELALVYRARGMAAADAESMAAAALAGLSVPDGAAGPAAGSVAGGAPGAQGSAAAAVDGSPDAGQPGHRNGEAAASDVDTHGTAWGAAVSSFCFFGAGALIPVLPYLAGLHGSGAMIVATALVTVALSVTGAIVGLLSGTSPVTRALRQVAIGLGAAAATYLLGLLFGATVG